MDYPEYLDWFSSRVTELRMEKGVSARDMSLSLGQSESYINKIENKKTLPSMTGFIYICEYFRITPEQFFSIDTPPTIDAQDLLTEFEKLTPLQAEHILQVIRDLTT